MDDANTHTLHQGGPVHTSGLPLAEAKAAMILIHGRGASAVGMLELAKVLHQPGFAYLAPQAANHTWYPYSFLAPIEHNEPWLSSALETIADLLSQVEAAGIPAERTVLAGFSQGACLASEFVARHAQRYGSLLLFSGGLIGPPGTPRDYPGSLASTPVFIGCSDTDPHIPLERVHETTASLEKLGAQVSEVIYPNMGHTIIQDQIDRAMKIVQEVIPPDPR
jgi:predicted esterase